MNENQAGAPVENTAPINEVEQSTPTTPTPETHPSMGPIIGTIVIIAVLAVGGLYYWGAQLNREEAQEAMNSEMATTTEEAAPTADELLNVNSSDEIADIEADLQLSNFDNLDAELNGEAGL